MSNKILITSALPYANGPLHFGHIAGAYLPGDCYARFQRLQGADVLYVCGSDEYGVAITLSADLVGRAPKEHVDLFHAINKQLFEKLGFSFDHYSRTTWEGHVKTTQQFFLDLLENGFIEERVTDQLYSEKENRFLADRYVIGRCPKCHYEGARGDECQKCGASYEATDLVHPHSKLTGSPLVRRPTKHWFLRFDLFKEKLNSWIKDKPWKANVLNFAQSYIDDLRPRAITRDSDWGVKVPLPGTEGKVFYVWFDAPIGYISASQEGFPDRWKEFWLDPETKLVQFIGKDNIPFHAVFFPAMLMGQNQPYKLVDELPANEFLNLEGKQFSKSDGWTIDLERFFQKFTTDQIRYYIAANAPENHDAEFSWKDFQSRCNAELLGKYGNLINRTLVFVQNHSSGIIPQRGELDSVSSAFLEQILRITEEARHAYSHFCLRKAAQCVMELAQAGNVYFDTKKPWLLAKNIETICEMQTCIELVMESIKLLALISSPIIPHTANQAWKLLGFTGTIEHARWDQIVSHNLPSGQKLPQPHVLFQRIEDEMIGPEIEQLHAKKTEVSEAPQITIDDVRKLDLRVGQILSVERVPKSKKMLKLSIALSSGTRTILSGIGEGMTDLTLLIGKKVIVVANLKPATLMGLESEGMILSADTESGIELPLLLEAPIGSCVR